MPCSPSKVALNRTTYLARHVETNAPVWVDALGSRPVDPAGQQTWLERAGFVAGYREAFDVTTVDHPIGPAPTYDRVDAHAWWTRAATAITNSPAQPGLRIGGPQTCNHLAVAVSKA